MRRELRLRRLVPRERLRERRERRAGRRAGEERVGDEADGRGEEAVRAGAPIRAFAVSAAADELDVGGQELRATPALALDVGFERLGDADARAASHGDRDDVDDAQSGRRRRRVVVVVAAANGLPDVRDRAGDGSPRADRADRARGGGVAQDPLAVEEGGGERGGGARSVALERRDDALDAARVERAHGVAQIAPRQERPERRRGLVLRLDRPRGAVGAGARGERNEARSAAPREGARRGDPRGREHVRARRRVMGRDDARSESPRVARRRWSDIHAAY